VIIIRTLARHYKNIWVELQCPHCGHTETEWGTDSVEYYEAAETKECPKCKKR
jgi:predicted RNA-binding Zn-ribbon protein involved in translation (DUF1610 family)